MDLLLKSGSLLPHQAKDLAHVTHIMHNLHNQKLQHYVLGKKPTTVQNAIMLVQKGDVELHIIEGLHNHDSGYKVNNIYNKQNNNQNKTGPCHTCNGPHLVKDCEESICKRCMSNLDSHTSARCPRRDPIIDSKSQTLLTLITALKISLMVTMIQVYTCPF